MAKQPIPRSEFIPHPVGQHEGEICLIEDLGIKTTAFGDKHKCSVRIQSETAMMDDGQPFIIQTWYTISGHPKSSLRQFRELIAERPLSDEEAYVFDTDDPLLLHKRVGFVVVHDEGKEGGVFANIKAIWPLKDGSPSSSRDAALLARKEYFLRLVDVRADNNLMKAEEALRAARFVGSEKCVKETLEEGIKRYEEVLREAKIALPPETNGSEKDDGLPF